MWEPNELRGTWLVPNYYDVATYVDDVAFYHSVMEPLHVEKPNEFNDAICIEL